MTHIIKTDVYNTITTTKHRGDDIDLQIIKDQKTVIKNNKAVELAKVYDLQLNWARAKEAHIKKVDYHIDMNAINRV